MAAKPSQEKNSKSFAEFVNEAPDMSSSGEGETISLTGTIFRAQTPDRFVLMLANGQAMEMAVSAVRDYEVVQDAPTQRTVQLQVDQAQLNTARFIDLPTSPLIDNYTQPNLDFKQLKESIKDLIKDNPKDLIKDNPKESAKDLIKDSPKDLITDPLGNETAPWNEGSWGKEGTKDPLLDPNTGAMDTLVESIGGNFGGGVVNPQLAAAQNVAPFIMATPHQAPPNIIAMQQMAAQPNPQFGQLNPPAGQFKPLQDPLTRKELIKDPLMDPITLKEMIKDGLQDPITLIETIDPFGRLTNPVWNLPGLLF